VAVRPILLYPDSLLKSPAASLSLSDPSLPSLIQDMVDTLDDSPGVALAAPQIGYSANVILVDVARKKGERGHGQVLLLNPRILHQNGQRIVREGCLSVPDYTGNVRRYEQTVVEGMTPDGRVVILTTSGFEALAFQHEIDHLGGILFLDRIESLSTDLFRRRAGAS
jgi:peptide deformylase